LGSWQSHPAWWQYHRESWKYRPGSWWQSHRGVWKSGHRSWGQSCVSALMPLCQIAMTGLRRFFAFLNGPDNQALTTAGIAGDKHAIHRCAVTVDAGVLSAGAHIVVNTQPLEQHRLGPLKANSQQHQLRVP